MGVVPSLKDKLVVRTHHPSSSVMTVKEKDVFDNIIETILEEQVQLVAKTDFFSGGKETDALAEEVKILTYNASKKYAFNPQKMIERVLNFFFGYGILQPYIINEDISDIDYTRWNYGTLKINGKRQKADVIFQSEKDFTMFSHLLIIRNGGALDENYTHRRESDEKYRLRINVAIAPRNVTGTSLIIRKHRMNPYDLDDLVRLGMIDEDLKEFFRNIFYTFDKNVIFVGKGASGKTTLLRACLMEVNPLLKVLVAEKDTELYLNDYPNFIIQRIKKGDDGGIPVTLKNLVNDGLTMSLDGMVVGEMVDSEVYDLLTAGLTDHTIASSLHTSGYRETPERIVTMIDTSNLNLPEKTINSIIAESLDIIVYMKDFKVQNVVFVDGYDKATDNFKYTEYYKRED